MKRLKHVLLFGIMIIFGVKASTAQNDTVYKFSLSEAQDFAINNFFVTKNAALDIESAQKKIWETTAIGLPQVSGSVSYQYVPGDIPVLDFGDSFTGVFEPIVGYINDVGGVTDPNRYTDYMNAYYAANPPSEPEPITPRSSLTYSLTVSQLIFSGEYIVGLQASKAYKSFSVQSYEKAKINIKEGIAGSYYGLLILKENKKVLDETLENLTLTFNHTKKFYEQGLLEDTDVDQLELTVKRTENSLRTLENQIKYLSKLFNYQIGLEANVKVDLTDSINELITKNIINPENLQFNLENNIDFNLLSTQEKLQLLSLRREKSLFLPQVSGFYQYSDKTEKATLDFTINHIIGLNVNIPIATSGMRMAKVSQAKIELDKAQNMKEQEAQRLIIAAQQAQFDYNTALENYNNEKQNFELSERVYNKTTARFNEGMVSALDLSIINNQFLQAQLSLTGAIQQLLSAKTKLDKSFNQL